MGFLFSKPTYDPRRDIPDLTGKVVLVTGANAGIGLQTSEQLAIHGAKVYLACRTESKARAAIAGIEKRNPELNGLERLVWLPLDLSSLKSAKSAAEEFLSKEKRLDILVNNAGRLPEDYVIGPEGIELSIAVNHLGHFVFTIALLPLLKETARRRDSDVRIVVLNTFRLSQCFVALLNLANHQLTSEQHTTPGRTTFRSLEDLNDPQSEPGRENLLNSRFKRYGTTKLLNILFTRELQRRLDEVGAPISALAVHPGGVATEGTYGLQDLPWYLKLYLNFFTLTPLEGAYTSLFAATSAQVAAERTKYQGRYVVPVGKISEPSEAARDAGSARALWEVSEKIVSDVLGR